MAEAAGGGTPAAAAPPNSLLRPGSARKPAADQPRGRPVSTAVRQFLRRPAAARPAHLGFSPRRRSPVERVRIAPAGGLGGELVDRHASALPVDGGRRARRDAGRPAPRPGRGARIQRPGTAEDVRPVADGRFLGARDPRPLRRPAAAAGGGRPPGRGAGGAGRLRRRTEQEAPFGAARPAGREARFAAPHAVARAVPAEGGAVSPNRAPRSARGAATLRGIRADGRPGPSPPRPPAPPWAGPASRC